MTITSRALNKATLVLWELDLLWDSDFSLLATAKLTKFSLSPTPNGSVLKNRHWVHGSTSDVRHRLAIEYFDILGSRCNFNALWESQLAFEASSPSKDVSLICEDQSVIFSTWNLDNPLVSQRLQNGWIVLPLGTTMANSTIGAWSVGENIPISSQVDRVIATSTYHHKVTHWVFVLLMLGSRLCCISLLL